MGEPSVPRPMGGNTLEAPKTFQLELEVEGHQVKETLGAIIHTILFHRLLSPTKPKDVVLFGGQLTYIKCDDLGLEREVENYVRQAMANTAEGTTAVTLSFYERRERKGWLFTGSAESEWERWVVRIATIAAGDGGSVRRNLISCLLYISTMTSEYREHVPTDGRINYRLSGGGAVDSWGGVIKKIIADSKEVL